ncbi:hypothetical protein [Stenotrophomonas sp. RAC2]|uniref:hypothetical protein n=1 Tax=Stenotrophomonas sp. RAC2 TaxID=3064902 RepID=UPI002719A5B3|nr:hypothetical protein [Stenotrophomonas sp. RAC2]MDV9040936.1 hypothetical protein [Stenotrophomonas sp. RAC2]
MSSKHWKVGEVECVAGFRIIPKEGGSSVAIAIQRDPNAHGLHGITVSEALGHARLIAAAPEMFEALDTIGGLSRALRQGGPDPMDLQGLSDALEEAVDLANSLVAQIEGRA